MEFYFSHSVGNNKFQLTNSIIFQRGRYTTVIPPTRIYIYIQYIYNNVTIYDNICVILFFCLYINSNIYICIYIHTYIYLGHLNTTK